MFEFHRDTSGANGAAKAYVETYVTGSTAARGFSDMLGREVSKRTKGFDGRFVQVDTEYDSRGRAYRSSEPYFTGDPIVWNARAYDAFNRVVGVTAAEGNTSTFQYNALGQRTGATHGVGTAAESSVVYTWDRLGRQLSEDDPDRGLVQLHLRRAGADDQPHEPGTRGGLPEPEHELRLARASDQPQRARGHRQLDL